MSGKSGRTLAVLLAGISSTALARPAAAQGAPPSAGTPSSAAAAASGDVGVGEIIVQARRVNERLQDVPLSITALDHATLERQQIVESGDLQRTAPGVVVRATAGSNDIVFSIRGQSVDFFSNSQPGVLPYLNDVQNASIGTLNFYDLESVQVLKGPQGTLFGRNATGGAVLLYTAKPVDSLEGFATVRVGSYDGLQVTGALNIPINDAVQLRAAGDIQRRHGYITNILTGRDYNNRNSDTGRLSLRIAPNGNFENITVVSVQHVRERSGINLLVYVQPGSVAGSAFGNPAFIAANPQYGPNGIFSRVAAQLSAGPWRTYVSQDPLFDANQWSVSNTTRLKLNDQVSIKNIFGYAGQTVNTRITQGGTDLGLAVQRPSPNGHSLGAWQVSDEFQLIGKALDSNLDWLVGGFYSHSPTNRNILAASLVGLPTINGGAGRANNSSNRTVDQSYAVFGQGTYHLDALAKGLSIVAGGRWTAEKTQFNLNPGSALAPAGSPVQEMGESKPSWLAGLNYQPTRNLLLYVVTRGSWRTGGFNYFSPLAVNRFEPETTKDVEVGLKSSGRLADKRFTFNIAVYNQNVDNAQRLATGLVNGNIALATFNAPGGARVQGLELAATFDISQALRMGAAYTYTDAVYGDPRVATVLGAPFALVHYADVPRNSGSVYADLDLPTPRNVGKLQLHVDYYVQGRQYYSNTIDPNGAVLPTHGLLNGKLTLADVGPSRVSFALFVRNALNKKYYIGGASNTQTLGYSTVVPGEPRMVGAEVHYDF
jgi:iron complex outermembrane receptor protein